MRGIKIPVVGPIFEVEVDPHNGLSRLIGGWIERVVTKELYELDQSSARFPSVSMWVDEEGLLKQLAHNPRASHFYPLGQYGIAGPAILLGEHDINSGEGFTERDVCSLPDHVTVDFIVSTISGIKR